jgi:hypothetical protein
MDSDMALLELKARHYQPDPNLDRAAELFATDRAAFNALPNELRSRFDLHQDFKAAYVAAVKAGAIKADRGPVT